MEHRHKKEQGKSQDYGLDQKNDKFPGQETGIIRVFIKRSECEESVQLSFDLFDE